MHEATPVPPWHLRCYRNGEECRMAMRTTYVAIAGIWVASLVAGRHMGGTTFASPNAATSAELTAQPLNPAGEVFEAPSVEGDDPPSPGTDLVGNEVEHAIADYRIDLGGSVYERHSPETAVEQLGSPST